jgi:hypothetical protein
MKHMMVDIETLASEDTALVLSIGACEFNMRGEIGETFLCTLDIDDQIRRGFKVSGDTILWWMQQDKEAHRHLVDVEAYQYSIQEAANAFIDFRYQKCSAAKFIWAKPPQFDIVILRHMFKKALREWPFHYSNERDLRTLLAVFNGPDIDISNEASHDPLSDAIFQARVAAHCWQHIRGTDDQSTS